MRGRRIVHGLVVHCCLGRRAGYEGYLGLLGTGLVVQLTFGTQSIMQERGRSVSKRGPWVCKKVEDVRYLSVARLHRRTAFAGTSPVGSKREGAVSSQRGDGHMSGLRAR
jgi:hypothetical protein